MQFEVSGNVVKYSFNVGADPHVVYAMVIPEKLPPSFNEMVCKSFEWTKNQRRWIEHYMSKYCKALPAVYLDKRTVRIDLFKKSQKDDEPNLDGRSKCVLDAMKQKGMIVDDNHKWLGWARVWQRKHSEKSYVVLVSETLDVDLMKQTHDLAPNALSIICP